MRARAHAAAPSAAPALGPYRSVVLGFSAGDVTKVVIGHAHWDHAGQLSDLPNAVLYVQKQELAGIEWALNYPDKHIRAINSDPGGCNRTPACGYMPLTMQEVYGKVLKGQAVVVDGEMEIAPGVIIHPAFRAHTAGSQLLEVPTSIGKLVFGSDAFSSYEGIRDWMVANIQQTELGPAVPRLRAVLQDYGWLRALHLRARAVDLYRQIPGYQELLGGFERRPDGGNRVGARREVAQALSRCASAFEQAARGPCPSQQHA